jgi:hypothetical protein
MNFRTFSIALAAAICFLGSVQAAFIVEPDNVAGPDGKANDHFSSLPAGTGFSLTATASSAVGLQANQTAFGNPANSTGPDQYTFRYTPGPDADNTPLAALTSLGNSEATDADGLGAGAPVYANLPQLATGQTGGVSGLYNVYFTTLTSTNVSTTGSFFDITNDAATVSLNPVNLNDAGTGPDEVAGTPFTGGANNRWLKIASLVHLTAGTTYTVTETANTASFVSQRAAGVMWELVAADPVPEPSTMLLLSLAGLGLVNCRRCRG